MKKEVTLDDIIRISTPNHPAPKDICPKCGGFLPFCGDKDYECKDVK